MTVQLSSLRVDVGLNASGYAQGARQVEDANARMQTTAGALSDAQERLGIVLDRGAGGSSNYSRQLDRTIGGLDRNHRAAAQFTATNKTLTDSLERGRIAQAEYDRLMGLAATRYRSAIASNQQLGAAFGVARGQLQGYAGQLGIAGTMLGQFGATGLVVAGTVGAATLALYEAQQAAHRFAGEMGRLRDSAEILGLNTMQLQAITDAGAAFALTEEKISTGLQRFVSGLDELRRGQGTLFETLQRTDPALARQMAGVRDTAAALDLMAAAYGRADTAARAALSRAAFGKTGFDIGLLVQSIGSSGGVDSLTAQFRRSGDAMERELIDRVRLLKREIDDMSADASKNLASIYSPQMLEMQHRSTSLWLDMTRAARTFSVSSDLQKFMDWSTSAAPSWLSDISIWPSLMKMLPVIQDLRTPGFLPPDPVAAARRSLATGLRSGQRFDGNVWSPFAPEQDAKTRESAEFQFNVMRQWVSLLGQAATPAEQLRLKQLELAAAAEKHGISQGVVNRALGAFTDAQRQAETAARSRLGIISEEELRVRALEQVRDAEAKGYVRGEAEKAEATRNLMIQARDTYLSVNRLAGIRAEISFDRKTAFLSAEDVQIAQTLRKLYGEDIPAALASTEAAALRANAQLKAINKIKARADEDCPANGNSKTEEDEDEFSASFAPTWCRSSDGGRRGVSERRHAVLH